jgi:hypothetical protein
MYQLLAGNPEQEQLLLERLVNKLGDPTRTVASKAMYHLTLLLGNKIFMNRSVKNNTFTSKAHIIFYLLSVVHGFEVKKSF